MKWIPLMWMLLFAVMFYAAIPLALIFHHWWIWLLMWIISLVGANKLLLSDSDTPASQPTKENNAD